MGPSLDIIEPFSPKRFFLWVVRGKKPVFKGE